MISHVGRQVFRAAARNARVVARAPPASRAFSVTPLRLGAGSTDGTLTAQLSNEIKFETENATSEQPEWVRVFNEEKIWSIEDKSGSDEIVLSRQFGNESVRVLFSISDLEQEESGAGDVEEPVDEIPAYSVRMSVSVTKPDSGALTIDCVSQNESILIDNISFYKDAKLATQLTADADWERRGLYIGPVFDHLDLDVQSEFQQYLTERGIDERLATFVPEYAVYKEQKEYVKWLNNVKSFIEA